MVTEPKKPPDKCCLKCHFLTTRISVPVTRCLTCDERKRLADGEMVNKVLDKAASMSCDMKVWHEPHAEQKTRDEILKTLQRPRSSSCFFYPHTTGLLLKDARPRAERRHQLRTERRNFWMTVAVMVITSIGVVVAIITRSQ